MTMWTLVEVCSSLDQLIIEMETNEILGDSPKGRISSLPLDMAVVVRQCIKTIDNPATWFTQTIVPISYIACDLWAKFFNFISTRAMSFSYMHGSGNMLNSQSLVCWYDNMIYLQDLFVFFLNGSSVIPFTITHWRWIRKELY